MILWIKDTYYGQYPLHVYKNHSSDSLYIKLARMGWGRDRRENSNYLHKKHHNQMKARIKKCMASSQRTGNHRISQLWEKLSSHRFTGQKYPERASKLACTYYRITLQSKRMGQWKKHIELISYQQKATSRLKSRVQKPREFSTVQGMQIPYWYKKDVHNKIDWCIWFQELKFYGTR